jgi:hypothetical protein
MRNNLRRRAVLAHVSQGVLESFSQRVVFRSQVNIFFLVYQRGHV